MAVDSSYLPAIQAICTAMEDTRRTVGPDPILHFISTGDSDLHRQAVACYQAESGDRKVQITYQEPSAALDWKVWWVRPL